MYGKEFALKKRPTRNSNMHRHSMTNIVSFLPKKFQKWNGYFFVRVWPPRIDPMVFSLVKMKLLTQRLITHVPGEYALSIRCRWHCGHLFSILAKNSEIVIISSSKKLTLLGLGLIEINAASVNFNNPRPSLQDLSFLRKLRLWHTLYI